MHNVLNEKWVHLQTSLRQQTEALLRYIFKITPIHMQKIYTF